jgi:hypothetical protein
MKNLSKLKSLLADLEKNVSATADTEALRPRLEGEIATALAGGDALSEKVANSIATKRNQLELIPAKMEKLSAEAALLTEAIKSEFESCNRTVFDLREKAVRTASQSMESALVDLLPSDQRIEPQILGVLAERSKLVALCNPAINHISFHTNLLRPVEAAQELIRREAELLAVEKLLA